MKQIIKAKTVPDAINEVIGMIDARYRTACDRHARSHTVHDRQFAAGAMKTLEDLRGSLSTALISRIPAAPAQRYFSLLERNENGRWQIAFGDYDREVVVDEMRDLRDKEPHRSRSPSRYQIMESGPTQDEIDAELVRVNRLGPIASIPVIVVARKPRKNSRASAAR